MEFLQKIIRKIIQFQTSAGQWRKVVRFLECVTVFVTTYALILPAISLSQDTARQQDGIVFEESADTEQADAASWNDVPISPEQTEYAADGSEQSSGDAVNGDAEAAAVLTGTIYPKTLDLRFEKKMDSDLMEDAIPRGTVVTVLEDQKDGWLLISVPDGRTGYVKAAEIFFPGEKVEEKRPKMTFELIADKDSPDTEIVEDYIDGTFPDPVTVRVEAPSGAFPAGTTMKVNPIAEEQVREAVESVMPNTEFVSRVSAVDITFIDIWGDEIEPDAEIKVSLTSASLPSDEEPHVVHVDDEGQAEMVEAKKEEENVVFESDKFSVFAVVETIEKYVMASDGHNFKISVTCGTEAGVPWGSDLAVDEITEESPVSREKDGSYENAMEYGTYLGKIREALELDEAASFEYIRLFDIRIVDGNGQKIEITAPVEVKIELADREENQELNVVHFADGKETGDLLENIEITGPEESGEGSAVSFEADGFSVYALVEAREPVVPEIEYVTSLDELTEGTPFLLSYNNLSKYFTNALNGNSAFIETTSSSDADEWYFENAGSEGKYYLYTYVNDQKKYLKRTSGNNVGLSDSPGSVLELSSAGSNKFYIKLDGDNRWLQHSNGGGGIRFYTDNNNALNSQISITYASSYVVEDDPYELDGTTIGIVYDSGSLFCTALMQDSDSAGSVAAEDMVKMDTKGHEENLFVPVDSDITEWTFHNVSEDKYYITAGDGKYLTIMNGAVSLVDEPTENSLIQVVPGTGANAGNYSFTANGCTLTMTGTDDNREFTGVGNKNGKIWFKLAEKSALSEDDYLVYSAKKIRVSDPADEVVLYTRIWNGTSYEFYVVNYDGSLIRCYDEGDLIKWVGNQYQTAVWELTEHTKDDGQGGSEPNGYYELKNTYSGQYIAPQLGDNTLFSDEESYLNLDGRFYQEDYTKIRSWDDTYYSYMGLKVDLENHRVVPCPSSQADDFYFARLKDLPANLTEVATVDNYEFGITMKMIDFNNSIVSQRDSEQTRFFGRDSDRAGLLSTYIDEATGYPIADYNQTSLGELFSGGTEVNKLFIQSVYEESGYFEYDSTKNFAYLAGNEFEVYDQLGTIERKPYRPTTSHGQFMPYNSLVNPATGEPWPYSDMYSNITTVTGDPLSEDDPRYGEGLHEIPASVADYFFGMEMSAAFTQTPDGTDAWGNDIIFEFSGDDDFWLYVDGELVLDLGGVHTAMSGSVNFATGIVTGRNGQTKTLRQIFESNYRQRNPGATAAEVNTYLQKYFVGDGTVFRPYSTHSMNIYYMERGAGASNLHMRFNLAAVKPGEVTLSKKITGSDDVDYDLMEFPYRILYQTQEDIDAGGESWTAIVQDENDPTVTYQGSKRPVKYADSYTPVGAASPCENVFFLKPGENASIKMPVDAVHYKIVECGVNMNIFESVKANTELLSDSGDTGRHDYETSTDTVKDRPEVVFENEVDPDSLRTLTITKNLRDEKGNVLTGYEPDSTTFNFRVSMSAQDSAVLTPVRNKEYFVRDNENNYCRWDVETQRFVSLGISSYPDLAALLDSMTASEKTSIIFETSNNGAVSRIPGGYSVEFRGLPVDSSFQVIEREDEIPAGYTLVEYERDQGSYISEEEPNKGTIRANEDPHVLVHNKRGWGLTAEKVWSDADYMDSHDDIYIAVYVKKSAEGEPELLEGTVRRLKSPSTSLYYYFDELEEDTDFDDYEIFEVLLTDPVCDADGNVTSYSAIEKISEGGTLTVGGKPKNKAHQEGFTYDVEYTKGEATGGDEDIENVRTDTIENTRQGIKLIKTDWNGQVLPGAVFTLKDEDGVSIGADSYTSDADGLITIAYLDPGTAYTLEETVAPSGFQKPSGAWSVEVENNVVSVSGDAGSYEITQAQGGEMAVVTLKDKGFSLQAVKVDADNENPLEGAVFALYKQMEAAGGKVRDQRPIPRYEALTAESDGVIPGVTSALKEGVYYLSEVTSPSGYKALGGDLVFTVSKDGIVEIPSHVDSDDPATVVILNNAAGQTVTNWIASEENEGHVTYTITIPNEVAGVPVKILKVDQSRNPLAGAEFSLSGNGISEDGLVSTLREIEVPGAEGQTVTEALIYENPALPVGEYTLTETGMPSGYNDLEGDVTISVESTSTGIVVTAKIGDTEIEYPKVAKDPSTGEWSVEITNQSGAVLPYTGGPGTEFIRLLGVVLTVLAGAGLVIVKRRRDTAR